MASWQKAAPIVAFAILAGTSEIALAGETVHQPPANIAFGKLRHADLLGRVIPGLRLEGDRAIGDQSFDVRLHDNTLEKVEAPVSLSTVQSVSFNAAGQSALALLAEVRAGDAGEGDVTAALLVAFSLADDGKPIDAVNAGLDRFTAFSDPAVLTPGPAGDILITHGSHSNSSQGYRTDALFFVKDGKLRLIDTIFTFTLRSCGIEDQQTPSFAPLAGTADRHGGFVVAVRDRHERFAEDCADGEAVPDFDRTIAVTYRWDEKAGNYTAESDALKALAAEAEQRF